MRGIKGWVLPRWESNAENYPYTARGFTGSENIVLPELTYEKGYVRDFQNGDTLNIRDSETGNSIKDFNLIKILDVLWLSRRYSKKWAIMPFIKVRYIN